MKKKTHTSKEQAFGLAFITLFLVGASLAFNNINALLSLGSAFLAFLLAFTTLNISMRNRYRPAAMLSALVIGISMTLVYDFEHDRRTASAHAHTTQIDVSSTQ